MSPIFLKKQDSIQRKLIELSVSHFTSQKFLKESTSIKSTYDAKSL